MWKEYSISYIKKNKITSISIMIAAFIASLFISLVSGIFYNMWTDNVSRLVKNEGDWQGRLVGNVSEEDVQTIESFSNVKEVVVDINENGEGRVVSVYFVHPTRIYEDLPKIASKIGMDASGVQYHNSLLSQYFIFSPEEKRNPPLLLMFYTAILLVTCFSLILVIKNAFNVSMNARMYQLGILQSVGATPKQVCSVFLQEAFALCLLPILVGIVVGIGLCYGFIVYANSITTQIQLENAVFQYHFFVFLVSLAVSILTVWASAWIPAKKLSKMSPLRAIRGDGEEPVKRVKRFRILTALFGVEGELASKSLYARRKAFRTSALSLTLSFLVFSVFMDFITLSDISTKHTYFERYKDTWDVMVSIKDAGVQEAEVISELRNINGISRCIGYQKATAYTSIPANRMSDEIKLLGGYENLSGTECVIGGDAYLVEVPIVILDEESYRQFCNKVMKTDVDNAALSAITVNAIWDSVNSNFRHRKFIPFVQEAEGQTFTLFSDKELTKEVAPITISGYTDQHPDLREEYGDYGLLQIMSVSTYRDMKANLPTDENEWYLNILAASEEEMEGIEEQINLLLQGKYEYTLENRIDEEITNSEIFSGYKKIMGGLCGLLACIGIANVFANTLGYVYQRKREFARYISIGLTPNGVKKVLCLEAWIIGGKPILFSVPFNILFIVFAINASYLDPIEFIECMPIIPITVFAIFILASVGLSYYIGGRRISRGNIVDALKDDAMY